MRASQGKASPPLFGLRLPDAMTSLALTVALLILVACGALIYYAAVTTDEVMVAREARLVGRSEARRLMRLKDDVAGSAIWSDAYDATARKYDPRWAHVNFGKYFHDYLRHDVTVIFDRDDRLIYASVEGQPAPLQSVADFAAAARPMVTAIRKRAAARIGAGAPLGFARVADLQAGLKAGGRTYLASGSTIVPEDTYKRSLLGPVDPVVVSGVELSAPYLRDLGEDLGLGQFRLAPAGSSVQPAVSLRDAQGRVLGLVTWRPEPAGLTIYRRALWPILAIGLLVIATTIALILRLRRLAAAVDEARDRAEAGDRAKSDFIANMSHEIRTPLNGVLGMAQAMEAFELSPDQRERLGVIRDSGATLLALLNDVLDLSKIQAGKLELVVTPFSPAEAVRRVCAGFAELAAAKDLAIEVAAEPETEGAWVGDPLRIRQVISNLVSNAIKFTEHGAVRVAVTVAGEDLRFSVEDTGIGLTEEQIPNLFQKFTQADASTTRRYGGTGLGLSICRALVELMGGAIAVQSRYGEGARFTVTLPLRPAAELAGSPVAQAPQPLGAPERPLKLLAAEDNAVNQLVLRTLLASRNIELTLAATGREAVAAFAAGRFDVILMDVQMPEMNGIDATIEIRRLEAADGRRRTPILALSANVMAHHLDSYRAAGMDGCVGKPIDAGTLFSAVREAMGEPVEG